MSQCLILGEPLVGNLQHKANFVSLFNEEGRTYSFDHRAKSGFARGEGAGCLILKPLDQAIQDNDNIYSVIVNTGTNQDGKTAGKSLTI
jgi:acyl transferase domain-containing protein